MSKDLTREFLVSKGVRYVTEGNEIYFALADVKKVSSKEIECKTTDLLKKEIDGKFIQVVKISDVIVLDNIQADVQEVKVVEAELVPCGKGCGCVMTQEECEKALCEAEKEEVKKETKKTKKK